MYRIRMIVALLVVAGCAHWYWNLRDDGRITVDSVTYTKAVGRGGVYEAHLHTRKVIYGLICDDLAEGLVCFPLSAGTRHNFKEFGIVMSFDDQPKNTQVWTIVTQRVR
jgi:hypothetical protein